MPPLRLRLPLRADGRLLPRADDGLRHVRPGGRILALGRGVFELSGWSEQDVMGADVVSAFGLQGFEEEKNPVKLTLEWGVRRLTSSSSCAPAAAR